MLRMNKQEDKVTLFFIFNAIFVPYITVIAKISIQTLMIISVILPSHVLGVLVIAPSPIPACKEPTGLPLASWVLRMHKVSRLGS